MSPDEKKALKDHTRITPRAGNCVVVRVDRLELALLVDVLETCDPVRFNDEARVVRDSLLADFKDELAKWPKEAT